MLLSLIRDLMRPRQKPERAGAQPIPGPEKLHIGGKTPHPEWKILDVARREHTDYIGSCVDLSQFIDGTIREIYASHVLEHLGYSSELPRALQEFHRVLAPGGTLRVSVPDLATLCTLFGDRSLGPAERLHVMRMMFGGQVDDTDFHRVGLDEDLLGAFLENAGFVDITRVEGFGLFDDASTLAFAGRPISLNMTARKRLDTLG
jgi:predicted SAM-dependent methyltransferase